MKSFTEFHDEQQQLDEGIIRSGSVATFAARSASAGKKADQAYKRGLSSLSGPSDRDDLVEQLERINAALKSLLEGQLHQLQQARNHVALDTVGHLTNGKK
ncbi:hypothetical protein [Parasedimentitalea psychrophila]|uniref:Uncharacterized protein n=1 Tax=Parasedimentitalea psychrophila TaxID=2997337 RepID=A0A9Y2L3C2_9RHOB|nr:hypothetical protein [Parasedimentitalea psychrophila]WIY27368.1 hypothetical protein QPJ95_10900 [Parasedimentitalea psychrophila]